MKIKITTEQYNKILLNEQKNILLHENEMLAISKLLGVELSGQNKIDADNFLSKNQNLEKIQNTIETDNSKIKNFFEEKGKKNFEEFIQQNGVKLIKNFNKKAEELNLKNRIGVETLEKLK